MKIKIHDQDTHVNIFFPNCIVTGSLSRKIISYFVGKYGGDYGGNMPLTKEQIDRLLEELGRAAKRFKGLKLVDIEGGNGERVLVQL